MLKNVLLCVVWCVWYARARCGGRRARRGSRYDWREDRGAPAPARARLAPARPAQRSPTAPVYSLTQLYTLTYLFVYFNKLDIPIMPAATLSSFNVKHIVKVVRCAQ